MTHQQIRMNNIPQKKPSPNSGLARATHCMNHKRTTTMKIRAMIMVLLSMIELGLASQEVSAATLLPPGKNCYSTTNGTPLAAGTVNFYIPSTTTPKNTWQDSGQTILNINPVVLDSAGCAVIYGDGTYRQIVKDSLGNLIWDQLTASTGNQTGVILYGGTSTGAANVQSLGSVSGFTATDGQLVSFIAGFSNTGATTLSAGTGAISVRYDSNTGPVALTGNEIRVNNVVVALYTSGFFHLIGPPVPIQLQTKTDYQLFTASGTWTKPTFAASDANATTHAQCWGAGGSGGGNATGGGGGGGGYNDRWMLTSTLGATETVTIPAAPAVSAGGLDATFGSWVTACGGGAGQNAASGGGGGGGGQAAGTSGAFSFACRGGAGAAGSGGTGGGPVPLPLVGAANTDGVASMDGGYGGGSTAGGNNGGSGHFGGGGGGYGGGGSSNGGSSLWGGGGGGGGVAGNGGASAYGGAGGNAPAVGVAPGGGGGRGQNGARGECRITTVP